jgi:hypothetical protein
MPRIPDVFIKCVFYLYPSQAAAEDGEQSGGCGFFVSVPVEGVQWRHIYAVTNKHVVDRGSCTFRVNMNAGKSVPIETDERAWFRHPDGDDLAILPFVPPAGASWGHILTEGKVFATPDVIQEYDIGPGDDAFTIGRFINHDGKDQNRPVVRFGNIAQMPGDPVVQDDGFPQESYLVEVRSLSGFSGAPVYVNIPPFAVRPKADGRVTSKTDGPWLLGVNWGHLNDWKPVCDARGRPIGKHPSDMQVGQNSGMMGVIPIWKLKEMLDHPKMVAQRKEREAKVFAPVANSDSVASKAVTQVEPEAANPTHKEDFKSLLHAAATKRPQDG